MPRGTTCPAGWEEAECRDYIGGIMVADDAHALADALERALPYVRVVPLWDEEGTPLYTFDYQDKDELRELIEGLRESGDVLIT